VRGPASIFHGNLRDDRRLHAAGASVTLDMDDHDFTPIVQPQYCKWIPHSLFLAKIGVNWLFGISLFLISSKLFPSLTES